MRRFALLAFLAACGLDEGGTGAALGAPVDASPAEGGDPDGSRTGDAGIDATADATGDAAFDAPIRQDTGAPPFDAGCDGMCVPTELASGQDSPLHLAIDATNVYWTNSLGGTVMACPKAGCGAGPTTLATGQGSTDRIVATAGGLAWTNYGATIGYCPIPGCAGGPQSIATGQASTVGVAMDSANVYFTTTGDSSVKACARTGCGASPTLLSSPQATPTGMGLAGSLLVWTDDTTGDTGSVLGCTLPTCGNVTTYAQNLESPGFVAADAQNVYFTTQGLDPDRQGAVWSCPVAGCPGATAPILTGQTYASVIVVDGPNLYWTNGGHFPGAADGEVVRCQAASCAATRTVLAAGYNRPWGIAVDAAYVYFTATGNGSVLRVPK
jgi:hypothetical protein